MWLKVSLLHAGPVVHVLDASRSVPVAQTLLDQKRNMCAALSLQLFFLLVLALPARPAKHINRQHCAGALSRSVACCARGSWTGDAPPLLPMTISRSLKRCILPNDSFVCPLVPLMLFSCSKAFVGMTEDDTESRSDLWRQTRQLFDTHAS